MIILSIVYLILGMYLFEKRKMEHFHPVYLKNAHIPYCANLPAVKQFHLPCAAIEIVAKRYAVAVMLYLPVLRP